MGTFVRVIEAGSLSAAARQLRLSPAAVSRQLAALEEEVGTALVARTTRKLAPTPSGVAYYERCLRVLREVDEAQAFARTRGLAGALRVSVPVTFGLASVVPRIRALATRHPKLRLDVRLEDRIIDLALEGVDVAIRVGVEPPLSTDLVAQPLFAWRRELVASPSYLARRGVPKTPAALAKHDALSHVMEASAETWTLHREGQRVRVRVTVRCSSNGGHVLRDLAVDGAGIAMLPRWFVQDELAANRLRLVLGGWGSETVRAYALYRTLHRSESNVRALIEHLRASY